jgi:hypothetical protein
VADETGHRMFIATIMGVWITGAWCVDGFARLQAIRAGVLN